MRAQGLSLSASTFLVALAAALLPSLARAAHESPEDIRSQFERMRKQLLESDERQRETMSSLFRINKEMKHLVSERSKTDQERMNLESSAKTLAGRIVQLENRIKAQKVLLQGRLRAAYKLGGQGVARLLFSSSNSAQLERHLKILGSTARNDLNLMRDYSNSVAELSRQRQVFVTRLSSLRKARSKVSDQERMISDESQAKAKILDAIRRTQVKTLARLRTLRERGAKIGLAQQDDELLDLLLKPSFFERKGSLPSPIRAEIQRKFGLWKDSQYNVTLNHKGLFYRAPAGTVVNAVFPGKVAFSGSIDGFGSTLILDHGDHYYSVYGGLGEISAVPGTEIQEGQKIASAGNGLYFEIRHFSEPYDPQQWMKGQSP